MKPLKVLIIFLSLAVSFWAYPFLPAQIPSHWNLYGQIDGYLPKSIGAWLLPGLNLVLLVLFNLLPRLDPFQKKYRRFAREWEIIQFIFIVFFTYLHFLTFYFAFYPQAEFTRFMFPGLGLFFILLGNYLSKIQRNTLVGFKLPWTLADKENWRKTHLYAAWSLVIAGLAIFLESFLNLLPPAMIFAFLMAAFLLPCLYSFLLFKKTVHQMKFVYLFLAVLFILAVFWEKLFL